MIGMTLFGLEGESGFCVGALSWVVADEKGNLSLAESACAPFGERVLYEGADESPAAVLRPRRDVLDGPTLVVPWQDAGEGVSAPLPHGFEFRLAPSVAGNDFGHRPLGQRISVTGPEPAERRRRLAIDLCDQEHRVVPPRRGLGKNQPPNKLEALRFRPRQHDV